MSHRRLFVLAFIAGSPAVAAAQFTTFIQPVSRAADSAATVAVVKEKVHTDSIVNTQLTNIKTWVDSAAGTMAPIPVSAPDSAGVAMSAARTMSVTRDTPVMRDGARAPATASALPLVVLFGLAGLGLGGFLLFGAPAPATARDRA